MSRVNVNSVLEFLYSCLANSVSRSLWLRFIPGLTSCSNNVATPGFIKKSELYSSAVAVQFDAKSKESAIVKVALHAILKGQR